MVIVERGQIPATSKQDRERLIRAAWEKRGTAVWDPKTHGCGLLSLNIPAKVEVRPVRFGAPQPPYDNLEFRLVRGTTIGHPADSIICEDVVVETIEDAVPQPMYWPNSDDAANRVVQEIEEAKRKNIAAIASSPSNGPPVAPPTLPSGNVFNIPPQEQPSQTIGLSAADLRVATEAAAAALPITFADSDAVKRWLNGQSRAVTAAFAARAALRVVSTIKFPHHGSRRGSVTPRQTVAVFRSVSAAWAVAAYPGQRDVLRRVAAAAVFGLGNLKLPPSVRAAAHASAAATAGPPRIASHAATAVGYAIEAAGSRDREALGMLLQAMATDAGLLDRGFSTTSLAFSQLWP